MSQFAVHKTITINATPEKVWDALTNPEKTKKYFFNCEVISGWKEGDTITFKGRMFLIMKIEMTGKIVKAIPGKLLQYTLQNKSASDGSFSTVTDELTYQNGVTILSITDDVGDGPEAEKRQKKSEKGWDKILNGLKELVEAEA